MELLIIEKQFNTSSITHEKKSLQFSNDLSPPSTKKESKKLFKHLQHNAIDNKEDNSIQILCVMKHKITIL